MKIIPLLILSPVISFVQRSFEQLMLGKLIEN